MSELTLSSSEEPSDEEIASCNLLHQSVYILTYASELPRPRAPRRVWVQQTMDRPEPGKETETSVTMPGSCQLGGSK